MTQVCLVYVYNVLPLLHDLNRFCLSLFIAVSMYLFCHDINASPLLYLVAS